MLTFLLYLTVAGLLVAGAFAAAVAALARAVGGRLWPLLAAALLLIVGTVPPSVLGVLWYARVADFAWAIRGPGAFGHLGGGPAMLAALTLTGLWTAVCWTVAVSLAARARRAPA